MGEVATFHQGAAMLAGWKNAVVCQAVKPLLDFYHVCSLFFVVVFPFNLLLAKAAGTYSSRCKKDCSCSPPTAGPSGVHVCSRVISKLGYSGP